MAKLKSFVWLDFMSVKPYFTAKNLLIMAMVAVFLSAASGSLQMSIGIGFMLGTQFISYPFAIGEKSGMDALYVMLSIDRGVVVRGRYLFVLALNLFAVAGTFACALIGLFAARLAGAFQTGSGGNDPMSLVLALAALMVVVQIIQLPLFFKMGYAKARFFSIVPFVALMSGYSAFMSIAKGGGGSLDGLYGFLAATTGSGVVLPLAALALAVMTFASYSLSLFFYKKRRFDTLKAE